MTEKYDDKHSCPKCNGLNELSDEDYMENVLMECKTKCKECGHTNYWVHGIFSNISRKEVDK